MNHPKKSAEKRLRKLYKVRSFLKSIGRSAFKVSIDKTKLAIKEGRRLLALRPRFHRLKREIRRLRRQLKRYVRQCKRAQRRRTFHHRRAAPQPRRCSSLDADQTSHTPVCWSCDAWGSADLAAQQAMLDPYVGSFEGNFQTTNDWVQTDEAYNSGAQVGYDAAGMPNM